MINGLGSISTNEPFHGFDAVDAIPKEIGMVLLDFTGTVSLDVIYLSYGTTVNCLGVFGKAKRRGTEDWDVGFFGEAKDFDHVFDRTCHGRSVPSAETFQRLAQINHNGERPLEQV